MTEDAALGHALQLASGETAPTPTIRSCCSSEETKTLTKISSASRKAELKAAYGVISPRKVKLQVEGATVTAVRCDIQAYYAVLATIEYDSGDVVYVSGLTKLASISDIVNLVESVSLT